MAENVYVNIDNHHFKVWGYDSFVKHDSEETTIITYWGRIGLPMCRLNKNKLTFPIKEKAQDYIWNKIQEKIKKGYISIPNSQYFEAISQEKPLYQLINLIHIYQKAQRK